MKTILCYGDSNTWGNPPGGEGRYTWDVRWPGVLQGILGSDYRVVEEGLCGRTTCFDNPFSPNRNGLQNLPVALDTHFPLDLLIIMLGTNDLKIRYDLTPFTIAQGASTLITMAQEFQPKIPHILLISPPHVEKTEDREITLAFEGALSRSRELATHYKYFADKQGCHFLDAASVAKSSSIDGIHLDAENHRKLGERIAKKVSEIFFNTR